MNTENDSKRCQCPFCTTHNKYKWAVVMECPCGCHSGDGMTGHDSMCCSVPNGLKKNNPHQELDKAEVYLKELNRLEEEAEKEYEIEREQRYYDEMYEKCKRLPGDKSYIYIHEELVRFIKHENWKIVNGIFNIFIADLLINEDMNPNYLNSALVTTKGLKDKEEIKEVWEKGYKLLKKKGLI